MNVPTEPSADLRHFAGKMWETFVALQAQGFTERQALTIIGQILSAAFSAGSDDE